MVHIYPGLLLFLQFGIFFANTINEGRQQTLLGSVLQHKRKDVTILKTQSRLNKKLATNGPKGSWFACKAGRVLTFAFMAACAAPALSCWVLVLGLLSGSPFLSRGNVHIYIYILYSLDSWQYGLRHKHVLIHVVWIQKMSIRILPKQSHSQETSLYTTHWLANMRMCPASQYLRIVGFLDPFGSWI